MSNPLRVATGPLSPNDLPSIRAFARAIAARFGRGWPVHVRDELTSDLDLEITLALPLYVAAEGPLEAFLAPRLRSAAIDRLRGLRCRTAREQLVDAAPEQPVDAHAALALEEVESRDTLHAALATLPERERTVLELRWFEGLTWHDIATRSGRDDATVRRWHDRALESLRNELAQRAVLTNTKVTNTKVTKSTSDVRFVAHLTRARSHSNTTSRRGRAQGPQRPAFPGDRRTHAPLRVA
jgi:RNA polymerase sigma factor (sigma-70 family)